MAFVRHTGRRQTRKLDIQAFSALNADLAMIQYPLLRKQPEKAAIVLLDTVFMLPVVNAMIWKEAKLMAVKAEALRFCAQTRLASFHRKMVLRVRYTLIRCAGNHLATTVRRWIAALRISQLIALAGKDRLFRHQYVCSSKCQKVWRRYHSLHEYCSKKNLLVRGSLEDERDYRKRMSELRKRKNDSILFRQVRLIQRTDVLVTIRLAEDAAESEQGVEVQAYIPSTQRMFPFLLDQKTLHS